MISHSPLPAPAKIDGAYPIQETVEILVNRKLARDTFLIRLASPTIAQSIRPGQFLMIRLTGPNDPLLGRPFALYDTVLNDAGTPIALDVVYLVVGKVTTAMARLRPGEFVSIWGPLGNGFRPIDPVDQIALVAGGIGQTPFLAYVRELCGSRGYGGTAAKRMSSKVSIFYGVRSADLAAGVDDFRAAGAEVHLASNDGSIGYRGFVTDLLKTHPKPDRIVGCGPEPMLHALAKLAAEWNVPCDVSLETPMACGLGICFSCVTKVKTPDGWDYKRVCVDGPIFDAAGLVWD
jgi:dihydroorotate dehydrogenase electron transfer subunit